MAGNDSIRDQILKKGFMDVKVYISGLRQSHRLEVKEADTPHGKMQLLESRHYIPKTELVRLANDLQLPIRHKDTIVFPAGKMPKDLATRVRVVAEPEVIEAEVEE